MNLNETNPNSVDYYILYILILCILYAITMLIQNFLKNKYVNLSSDALDYYGKRGEQIIHDKLSAEQSSKRWRYLFISVLVKAITWVKAPYIFALYNRVHGFSRQEIGYLFAFENFVALFLGPLIGSLCDIYGRKFFCVFHCISVIAHISLRVTGNRTLAWLAQAITAISACLIDSAYESWINFEANFLFERTEMGRKMKNSYLREIFSKQIALDCLCSITIGGLAVWLYSRYGIFYPFYACIIFSLIAAIAIIFLWNENDMSRMNELDTVERETTKAGFLGKLKFSWKRVRSDTPLLTVGVIEMCYRVCGQLIGFIWTPLLEETIGGVINPGSVFICFMLARLLGSEIFEVF
jgi:hypothetical protein